MNCLWCNVSNRYEIVGPVVVCVSCGCRYSLEILASGDFDKIRNDPERYRIYRTEGGLDPGTVTVIDLDPGKDPTSE